MKTAQGIFWFAVGGVLGWPFSVALAAPFLVEEFVLAILSSREAMASAAIRLLRGTGASLFVLVSCISGARIRFHTDALSYLNSQYRRTSITGESLCLLTLSFTTFSAARARVPTYSALNRGISTFEISS